MRREPRSAGYLEWRVRLFGAGAILAVAGMFLDARWMVWTAVGVLAAGFLLRFLPAERGEDGGGDGEPTPH